MFTATQLLTKKITAIVRIIIFSFLLIIGRLIYLQVRLSHYFYARGQQNFLRIEPIQPPRGNILDRNGKLLATNRPVTNVYWHGSGNNSLSEKQILLLEQLEHIFAQPIHTESLKKQITYAEKHHQKLLLVSDISFKQLSKIAEQCASHENMYIDTNFKRYYPYQSHSSHIIGYLGKDSLQPYGQMGIEKIFEKKLSGKKGTLLKSINSMGKHIAQTTLVQELKGHDIQTTIDIRLQEIGESIFPANHTGVFIIMNPYNGALLTVISRPNFDPNMFLNQISHNSWKNLQKGHPFLNRAFNGCYPPGSIFKLVTISAAREHNLIPENSTWQCNGFTTFAGRKYWCHRRWGHGKLSTAQAVAQSCNVLFYEIGKNIDINLLAQYAFKFGLGQKTGINFTEKSGIVPSTEWKLEHKGEVWWPGETLSVTIGQSFLLVTPIQVSRMIASIFTNYLVTPRILTEEPIIKQPLEIVPETIEFLKKSMRSVVTLGTGKQLRKVKDIEIFAKTSTAQVSTLGKRTLNTSYLEHAWFVGYFQYKHYTPLVIVILVENAGTSQVATSIAKDFLIAYKKLMDK